MKSFWKNSEAIVLFCNSQVFASSSIGHKQFNFGPTTEEVSQLKTRVTHAWVGVKMKRHAWRSWADGSRGMHPTEPSYGVWRRRTISFVDLKGEIQVKTWWVKEGKFFFWDFVGLERDGPVVYPANTFDSRLRGD